MHGRTSSQRSPRVSPYARRSSVSAASTDVLFSVELLGDPPLQVALSVAKVPADTEAGRTSTQVPPCVDGCDRYVEEGSEFLSCEQRLELRHPAIVEDNPFTS